MQWIFDLIKHLAISRLFAVAVFATSAVLLFGHYYLPDNVPEMVDAWKLLAIATFVFTGVYLAVWSLERIWSYLRHAGKALAYWCRSGEPAVADKSLIELIARQPYESLNLLGLNYEDGRISRLELIQQAKSLSKRGLVEISRHDESIVSLTERGRQLAVCILVQRRAELGVTDESLYQLEW